MVFATGLDAGKPLLAEHLVQSLPDFRIFLRLTVGKAGDAQDEWAHLLSRIV